MLNNLNRRKGYTEVLYNYRTEKFFTDAVGNQFQELDIQLGDSETPVVAEETDPIFLGSPAYSITDDDIANWNAEETDPIFTASEAYNITSIDTGKWHTAYTWGNHANAGYLKGDADTGNWDTAYSWGNHADAGYLTSETDPVFIASEAYNITNTDTSNWDTAYGWGNHGDAGYLTEETDPVFTASEAYNITSTDTSNWNTAYTWGFHGDVGYLTAESDTLATVTGRGSTTESDITTTGKLKAGAFQFPTGDQLPATENSEFGDVFALNTDKFAYFYDGENWRKFNLYGLPTTDPPADSDWDNVLLRISFDPTDVPNGSTQTNEVYDIKAESFLDRYGDCTIQGAPSKFGGGAAKLKGLSYIPCMAGANSLLKDFLNNEFTIEFWFYLNENGASGGEKFSVWNKSSTCSFSFGYNGSGAHWMYIIPSGEEDNENAWGTLGAHNFTLKRWYHIAIVRNIEDGKADLYIDGMADFGATDIFNSIDDHPSNVMIFGDNQNRSADFYIDDIRISNFQRYTGDFFVPTEKAPVGPVEE